MERKLIHLFLKFVFLFLSLICIFARSFLCVLKYSKLTCISRIFVRVFIEDRCSIFVSCMSISVSQLSSASFVRLKSSRILVECLRVRRLADIWPCMRSQRSLASCIIVFRVPAASVRPSRAKRRYWRLMFSNLLRFSWICLCTVWKKRWNIWIWLTLWEYGRKIDRQMDEQKHSGKDNQVNDCNLYVPSCLCTKHNMWNLWL